MPANHHPTFRPATRDDVPRIVDLLADDEISRSRGHLAPVGPGHWAAYDAIEADPRNEIVVAEVDGEVVGTMQLTYIPGLSRDGAERAQVEAVRIASTHRGRGLGRAFMTWAVARAHERGCRIVQLTTDKRRPGAHRFYASLGFTPSHEGFKLLG
ncbi:GNAT family N-acetyltransferase [Herbidospora sp. NBRC 101105]|uniref:GNAT family N-acetyltransferase n=1 Tax=Herbidospora sp. NBRC 101105 TaxID=3032195 RepID=UPI0024A51083|nr:GNAT family N-acetyltransferase [Herbidospora sp. NBRC 101105]GLX95509.1 acetyltransferase [Herbidospora sp. NBRC 101105]